MQREGRAAIPPPNYVRSVIRISRARHNRCLARLSHVSRSDRALGYGLRPENSPGELTIPPRHRLPALPCWAMRQRFCNAHAVNLLARSSLSARKVPGSVPRAGHGGCSEHFTIAAAHLGTDESSTYGLRLRSARIKCGPEVAHIKPLPAPPGLRGQTVHHRLPGPVPSLFGSMCEVSWARPPERPNVTRANRSSLTLASETSCLASVQNWWLGSLARFARSRRLV